MRSSVETCNGSEAYRRAYAAEKMSQAAIEVEASRLLANPKLTLRVSELQAKHAKRHDVTVDTITAPNRSQTMPHGSGAPRRQKAHSD